MGKALVCAAGAPLIGNSIINGNDNTTSSIGGTFGVTVGDLVNGKDKNYTAAMNGDSQGNVSFTGTFAHSSNGHGAFGFGYSAGLTIGTSPGNVKDQNAPGNSGTLGVGPYAVSGTDSGGGSVTIGSGAGYRYSGAYDQSNTRSTGTTNCLAVAIEGLVRFF